MKPMKCIKFKLKHNGKFFSSFLVGMIIETNGYIYYFLAIIVNIDQVNQEKNSLSKNNSNFRKQ